MKAVHRLLVIALCMGSSLQAMVSQAELAAARAARAAALRNAAQTGITEGGAVGEGAARSYRPSAVPRTVPRQTPRKSALENKSSEIAQLAGEPQAMPKRSFGTNAPRSATTQSSARSSGVGLATAIGTGIGLGGLTGAAYAQDEKKLPKDFLENTDKATLLKMMWEKPNYTRQFAELVTAENIMEIDSSILFMIVWYYDPAAALFAPYAVENVGFFAKTDAGLRFVSELIEKDPKSAALFMPYAVENVGSLAKTYAGLRFVSELVEKDPKSAALFTPYAVENVGSLANTDAGLSFISELIQNDAKSAALFTPYAVKNVGSLAKTDDGLRFISELIKHDSKSAALFTPYAVKNVGSLVVIAGGLWLISELIEKDPKSAALFTLYAVKNVGSLAKTDNGLRFISELIKYDSKSAALFTPYAVKNVGSLVVIAGGLWLIAELIENDPKSAALFTPYAVKNFGLLADIYGGFKFMSELIKHDSKSAALFMPYAVENVGALAKTNAGVSFISELIEKDPKSAALFTPYAVENVGSLAETNAGAWFIAELVKHDPKSAALFTPYAVKNVGSLAKTAGGFEFILELMDKDRKAAALFTSYAVENFAVLSKDEQGKGLLITLQASDPSLRKIFEKKLNAIGYNDGKEPASLLDFQNKFFYEIIHGDTTPTKLHFIEHAKEINAGFGGALNRSVALRNILTEAIELEEQYKEGYYTFFHAQQWPYQLREMVYRNLWEQANNQSVGKNFKFMFTKEEHDDLMKQILMNKEKRVSQDIIEKGRSGFQDRETRNRQLFLNTSFFGNASNIGSSSAEYLISNSNVAPVQVSIKDMFVQFGAGDLYEKHRAEFEVLEKEYETLGKGYGNMFFLAVPKADIKKSVVQVVPGGYLTESVVKGKKTNDITVILDALSTNPVFIKDSDVKEFVLPLTDTAGLDPNSGIKIHTINAADPNKFAAWQAKFDALMEKVGKEFKPAYEKQKIARERGNKRVLETMKDVYQKTSQ